MLTRAYRLQKNRDIKTVFYKGKSLQSKYLRLSFMSRPQQKVSRFCFIVGLKISKLAPARNLLKRRMREAVRAFIPALSGPYNIVLTARPGAAGLSLPEISAELQEVLGRAGLLK